ncbi:MAG TPA: oxaloacetate decarboxylase [Candidatus Limnocylindrales bacterium]|nr:oxaloacetate decarboxylase [Candidatus Limnocylindrales bacterium]
MSAATGAAESSGSRLRGLIGRPPLVLPGCADALTARIAERAGFEAVYATGAGIANAQLGRPDVGLTTMTEVLDQVARIVDAVEVPVVADIDTGFGNAINAQRAVRAFERAGVAGVQIEDQVFPKRCGHYDRTEVVPANEFLGKLRAVLDARADPSLVVVARTDALAIDGFEAAVERANRFVEAGADVVFVEAPPDRETLAALPARVPGPLVANMVEGGRTPLLSAAELAALGYAVVLFANTALRVAAWAVRDALGELRRTGDARPLMDRMLSWDERQALVGLDEIEALDARYGAG